MVKIHVPKGPVEAAYESPDAKSSQCPENHPDFATIRVVSRVVLFVLHKCWMTCGVSFVTVFVVYWYCSSMLALLLLFFSLSGERGTGLGKKVWQSKHSPWWTGKRSFPRRRGSRQQRAGSLGRLSLGRRERCVRPRWPRRQPVFLLSLIGRPLSCLAGLVGALVCGSSRPI